MRKFIAIFCVIFMFVLPAFADAYGKVVFLKWADTGCQIATMNPDGTDVRILTGKIGSYENPRWLPDGKQIMFETPKSIEKMDIKGDVSTLVYKKGSQPDWQNSPNAPVIPQEKASTTWGHVKYDSLKK